MPDKKKKNTKESVEMEPRIVEVYGDDEILDQKLETKDQSDELSSHPQEEGERETLTVEVVGEEEDQTSNLKDQDETPTQNEKAVESDQSLAKATADKQDESAFDEEIGSQKKAVRSVFGVGLVVFLIVFGLTGWAFYLKTVWLPTESVSQVLVADASPTPLPTATPQAVIALGREAISLEILNGSGVVGLAGKVATTFKDLGYTSVETGNGDAVDVTEVYIKKDLEPQLATLMKDLSDALKVASVTGYLKTTDTMTARIVLSK